MTEDVESEAYKICLEMYDNNPLPTHKLVNAHKEYIKFYDDSLAKDLTQSGQNILDEMLLEKELNQRGN